MISRLLLFAALVALAGCASVQRTLSYPAAFADADVWVGGHEYGIWFHQTDPAILIQRGPAQQMGQALAQNWTIYSADQSEPEAYWRAAANAVLQPIGCQATEVTGVDQIREVTYVCMQGVNVRQQVVQRRVQWRAGIRVDEPTAPNPLP